MKLKALNTSQAMRYSRQISLAGFDLDKQEILINAKVLIIGVGGLGCSAAQYLCASGVGEITLVDDDIVDSSNLQRQILHFESSIGNKKVASGANTLKQINSGVKITTIENRLDDQELLAQTTRHNIVLDCSDNLNTRINVNRACYQSNVPLVSGSAIRMEGQVFCVVPSQNSACYQCISHFFGEQTLSCVESGIMSPVVGIIGATQAIEAIKILSDYGTVPINTLQVFDAMASHWESFTVTPIPDCKTCSETHL